MKNVGYLCIAVSFGQHPQANSFNLFTGTRNTQIQMDRIEREKDTVGLMIGIYCKRHHGTDGGTLCADCSALLEYAQRRLDRCPRGNRKTSCRKCPTHCYAPAMKARIKEVMRDVGPRMIFIHPVSAIRHLLSEL